MNLFFANGMILVVVLIALLGISAFLSASETALFSLPSHWLKAARGSTDLKLKRIVRMMERPKDILVTILIHNVTENILVQNTVSTLFDPYPEWLYKVGVPLVLTLVFGEILPKSLSLPHNTWVAQRIAGIIDSASKVLTILRRPITALTHGLSQLFLIFLPKEAEVTREELKHVLGSSAKGGMLLQQEAKLMGGALELQKLPVKEVMRPREEMLFYDIQDPIDRLYHLLVESETTRVPVCDGSLENLLGVITTRRLFLEPQKLTTGKQLIPLLKKPFYIPEVSKAWELLQLLRSTHESLAIVVDEYGSIAGLITQEDLIEIVVGEISDKRDAKDRYTLSGSDVMIASGKLTLSEFADVFGVSLTSEAGAQTLGGWMIEQLGEIPVSGTKMTHGPFLFYVLAAEPHRIRRIYVRRIG